MRDIKFKAWDKVTRKMYTLGFDVRYSGEVVLHR